MSEAANDNGLGVPPGVYSIVEAAGYLKISRRKLQDLIVQHPFYALNGNRKLFSQTHIEKIWEAMQCQNQSSPSVLEATTGTSVIPTATDGEYSDLLKPKTRKQPRRSSSNTKRAS